MSNTAAGMEPDVEANIPADVAVVGAVLYRGGSIGQ